ncbi:hypothetical protein QR680_006049 [Steinernema hermaphroditum]|uniref:Nuclear receptor domain-containing protein n=1 Tax=Steinernema hermaphroditum TaxID=289476 RepID=A0AA39LWQ9_9BILA|nr:hypothetical protein QR680_006049 [Steinernema hermaphroditum]
MSSSPPALRLGDCEKLCQVCGADAHGIHFQVISCRACAAFFRRSAECAHRYKCRSDTFECDVSKNAPYNCRLCRYKRCTEVGMTIEGLKLKGRDEISLPMEVDSSPCTSEMTPPPQSYVDIDGEQIPIEDLPVVQVEGHEMKYDVEGQMETIMKILDQPCWPLSVRETPMQSLLRGYHSMFPHGPRKARVQHELNFQIYLYFMRKQMQTLAKWAMECREFALLPLQDKRKMYCHFWNYVFAFERVARTIQSIKEDNPGPIYLVTDTIAVDIINVEFFMTGWQDEGRTWHREFMNHFRAVNELIVTNFIVPTKLLNLTVFETVYMCLYSIWNVKKLADLSPETYKIADRILDEASSELHYYYINELRTTNYVSRLSKLFKLLSGLESIYRFRKEENIRADLKKLWKSNIDDSEFNASIL